MNAETSAEEAGENTAEPRRQPHDPSKNWKWRRRRQSRGEKRKNRSTEGTPRRMGDGRVILTVKLCKKREEMNATVGGQCEDNLGQPNWHSLGYRK